MDELIDALYELDVDEDEPIFIHRGPDDTHHVECECWCYPLELTVSDLQMYSEDELREMLESFLALH